MVELLASCLAGAVLSRDASPFSGDKGGPPMTGQCFVAFDPMAFAGEGFGAQTQALAEAITSQDGARLPGARRIGNRARIDAEGVEVDTALMERIKGEAHDHTTWERLNQGRSNQDKVTEAIGDFFEFLSMNLLGRKEYELCWGHAVL